jgi:hypothetical protein
VSNPFNRLDEPTRRAVLAGMAKAAFGLTILPAFGSTLLSAADPAKTPAAALPKRKKPASKCIYLFMAGGMSQIDTFDPKPGSRSQGPLKAVSSKADGIQLGELMSRTAEQMKHGVVVRSINSNQGAHEEASYYMRTSYAPINTTRHPSLSAWSNYFQAKPGETLPGGIMIYGGGDHPGCGFLDSKLSPLPVGDPSKGVTNIKPPPGVDLKEMRNRLDVLGALNQKFYKSYELKSMQGHQDMYFDAVKLMSSKDIEAFEISREPGDVRARYGESGVGRACLLARRLVEKGVRFIDISHGGWDTHDDNFNRLKDVAGALDQGLSALVGDLASRGLLEDTLVCVVSEFGRTPEINNTTGRDHYPKAFSAALFGGGLKGGVVHGKTNADGTDIVEGKIGIPDLNATIAYGLGLPVDKVITSPDGRPFTIAHKGKPLTDLFTA